MKAYVVEKNEDETPRLGGPVIPVDLSELEARKMILALSRQIYDRDPNQGNRDFTIELEVDGRIIRGRAVFCISDLHERK